MKANTPTLDCSTSYAGDGPILKFNYTISAAGPMALDGLAVGTGRMGIHDPGTSGKYAVTVSAGGNTFYTGTRNLEDAFVDAIVPNPITKATFGLQVALPSAVAVTDPMVVELKTNGVSTSRVTINGSAPSANAGPDQTVQCTAGGVGQFQLDGLASHDPDGDTLGYQWTGTSSVTFNDSGVAKPTGSAPLGTSTIGLVVSDGLTPSAADTVSVTVIDTLPPVFAAPASVDVVACGLQGTHVAVTTPTVSDCSVQSIQGVVVNTNGVVKSPPLPIMNGSVDLAVGANSILWTATDSSGHSTTFTQTINVTPCWQQFGNDRSRQRRSSLVAPTAPNLAFDFSQSHLDIKSSPAVGADGTVYFGSDDNGVYAVRPNGNLKWRTATGLFVRSSPAVGTDGVVYVGSDDNYLYGLSPADGSVVCKRKLGLFVRSSPAIGPDGTVYVGDDDHKLYALSPGTCALKWTVTTGNLVRSSPAVGPDGTIYFGADDNKVRAINADGTVKWTTQTNGFVDSSPAVSNDGTAVYVGSDDNHLWALNAATGALLWKTDLHLQVNAAPAVGLNGTVYVGSDDGKLYALDRVTGAVTWSRWLGIPVRSSPAIDGNGILLVGADDTVFALRPADGSTVWSYATHADIESSPAIGVNGTVYVGSNDHHLYGFGPAQTLAARWDLDAADRGNCTCQFSRMNGSAGEWFAAAAGAAVIGRRRKKSQRPKSATQ